MTDKNGRCLPPVSSLPPVSWTKHAIPIELSAPTTVLSSGTTKGSGSSQQGQCQMTMRRSPIWSTIGRTGLRKPRPIGYNAGDRNRPQSLPGTSSNPGAGRTPEPQEGPVVLLPPLPTSNRLTTRAMTPSPNKITKKEYVELCYFTAGARQKARRDQLALNEDVLALERSSSSFALKTPVQASMEARRDEQLSWDEVMQARPQFLLWIEKLGWPSIWIRMHASFFYRLDSHEMRSQIGGTEALALYQAKYRREWHVSVVAELDSTRPGNAYNKETNTI